MSVPELRKGERIEKWKPLFDAATAGIRATEGGGKKALQMLPAHVCRSLAERELVVEVVAEQLETGDVETAFQLLVQNLDPPPDPIERYRPCVEQTGHRARKSTYFSIDSRMQGMKLTLQCT